MLLGFKTEFKLNDRQRTQLAKHCGVARQSTDDRELSISPFSKVIPTSRTFPDKIEFINILTVHCYHSDEHQDICSDRCSILRLALPSVTRLAGQ